MLDMGETPVASIKFEYLQENLLSLNQIVKFLI